ncbi:MAG: P-loop NTPase [Nanoarchaeota archaeon]|nr:P-loop NTPase [Nanoarchaeota archaeon]
MTRIILIASGKGGVGKTTMAANLATALTRLGTNVVVVDSNFSTGNLGHHFGLEQATTTLHDVLNGKARIDDAVYYHPSGVKFVPMGARIEDIERIAKKDFSKAIIDLVGRVDIIILDGAAGISEELEKSMRIANEMLIVTNPEIPALIEALKTRKISEKYGLKTLGVLVNKTRRKKYETTPSNIMDFTEMPVIGIIPEDEKFSQALSEKIPFIISHANTKSAQEINKVAAKIIGKNYLYKEQTLGYKIKKFLGL